MHKFERPFALGTNVMLSNCNWAYMGSITMATRAHTMRSDTGIL